MYHKIEQNTDEWMDIRRGLFTASSVYNLSLKESTDTFKKEINKRVIERITGETPDNFTNYAMQRGHELEPLARKEYEKNTFKRVNNGGFWTYDSGLIKEGWFGASPDGICGDGIIEIKCFEYNNFIEYSLNKTIPKNYLFQIQAQLLVTDKKWCDMVYYYPNLSLTIIRVLPDSDIQNEIIQLVNNGIIRVEEKLKLLAN